MFHQPARSSETPRVAIVTGATGGVARAVAERLGAAGMRVVVHYGGSAERAAETVSAITQAGGTATAFGADVDDQDAVSALFDHAEEVHGGVDLVVNTAGIMILAPIAEMSLDELDRCIAPTSAGPASSTSRPRAASAVAARSSTSSPRS